jgi:hypothetical protein
MKVRTCVTPSGRFVYGIHQPCYRIANFRGGDAVQSLGTLPDGTQVENQRNFPPGDLHEEEGRWIFEIPNPFSFRGATFIDKSWADAKAADPEAICLPPRPSVSFRRAAERLAGNRNLSGAALAPIMAAMPEPVLLALAATSTDQADLTAIAELCCDFVPGPDARPVGLRYRPDEHGRPSPVIHRHALFETVANNPFLPDEYKQVMVLRPGAQGGSEIVGEWHEESGSSHAFEYLRRNSYIPWGHYAANFADDTVRYQAGELTIAEMRGLRHLYYQRAYTRLAAHLDLPVPRRRQLTATELEELRLRLALELNGRTAPLPFNATLWGWNYGFDFAPSGYRLHASHQQIHQQYALLPSTVSAWHSGEERAAAELAGYGCGDLITEFIREFRLETGAGFFQKYLEAIHGNRRMDARTGAESLIVHQDEEVMLFVPKAQTSQWELQLITLKPAGNVLETDLGCRASLDRSMWIAMRILSALGARMVTTIEYPKRFDAEEKEQHLLYSFLPRLPESPGAFSEAQLRFINGHYPEDFAAVCRARLPAPL